MAAAVAGPHAACVCHALYAPCRHVHEQLSSVVREAAEAAVGSESLLLVLGALQVGIM